MKKSTFLFLSLLSINSAHAGFNGITHHSRANCANNESISWDWTANHYFWVTSDHYNNKTGAMVHGMVSDWQNTWRNAQVHWGEGTGGWKVVGWHYMMDKYNRPYQAMVEVVTDCSIYDGWWDRNR